MDTWRPHTDLVGDELEEQLLDGGTLTGLWARRWAEQPDRAMLLDDGGWVTGSELEERTAAVARRVAGAGVSPGDRVVISAASSVELVVAHVGCLRAGAVVVPTNAAYGRSELAHVVSDARPVMAIVDDDERAAVLTELDPSLLVIGPDVALPDPAEPSPLPTFDGSHPALIGYTSGTTGRPKGAVLSHANLLSSVNALRMAWRWTNADRLVLCLPLFHMHGLGVGLHGTLAAGGSAVLQRGFDPDAVFDAIAEHDATMFFGVPTMYHRLSQSDRAAELASLRLMVSGSAPLPAALHDRMTELTGRNVLERYGMTETAMLVSNPFDGERRAGTVGFPLPGVQLRLVGEPSEVQVKGPNVFSGYWERPDANAESFDDGWFRTGDVGSFDDEGYLVLDGRSKELIISGGFNVYPREVEDVLREMAGVSDVAVVGTPSEEWGEQVTAYVVGGPVSLDDVRGHVEGRLAPYKRPRLLHHVDELPRNALGKVQKHRLKDGAVVD